MTEWRVQEKTRKGMCFVPVSVKEVMGHKDISTTMDIYAEATEEKKQEIIASLQGKNFT